MKIKLMMICGSYPPRNCGVGDYTHRLVTELQKNENIIIKVLANIDWSISNYKSICKEIDDYNPQFIHVQFPSADFGLSLVPQMLSLKYKSIVTIHEASQFHPVRKLWLFPFSLRSELIFTNSYEKKYFRLIFPWFNRDSTVINLGSHIEINSNRAKSTLQKDSKSIIYFGQIRPKKGIEELLKLAKLIKDNNLNYRIKIAGHVLNKYSKYFEHLNSKTAGLPVDWLLKLTDEDISLLLSENMIGYLPFPDGASERRTSLFSLLNNKMLVYTTFGAQTPDEMAGSVIYVKDSQAMLNELKGLTSQKLSSLVQEKTNNAEAYLKDYSWPIIGQKHLRVYNDFINKIAN